MSPYTIRSNEAMACAHDATNTSGNIPVRATLVCVIDSAQLGVAEVWLEGFQRRVDEQSETRHTGACWYPCCLMCSRYGVLGTQWMIIPDVTILVLQTEVRVNGEH